MKIYTGTGDGGNTGLIGGQRVSKTHPRIAVVGTVDELNGILGLALALEPHKAVADWLHDLQLQLFSLGADLAAPVFDAQSLRITEAEIVSLEQGMDAMTAALPDLTNFILPGGKPSAAQIYHARSVCRRAERLLGVLVEESTLNPHASAFLNRLSDFLFTLARYENFLSGVAEEKWIPFDSKEKMS